MALINPVYTFIVPFLFLVTAPLAVFAGITTTLAFSVLIFRVIVVYLDIALSLVPHYFAGRKHSHQYPQQRRHDYQLSISPGTSSPRGIEHSPTTPTQTLSLIHNPYSYPHQQSLYRRRRRRFSSSSSTVSASSVPGTASDTKLGLIPSFSADRDFEGIGGWRSGKGDDDTWTAINSCFDFPDRTHTRSHHRNLSGGPVTPGDHGVLIMKGRARSPDLRGSKTPPSPNSGRIRTQSATRTSVISPANSDGYFPLAMSPTSRKMVPHSG